MWDDLTLLQAMRLMKIEKVGQHRSLCFQKHGTSGNGLENIVGPRANAGYQHFLFVQSFFRSHLFYGVVKKPTFFGEGFKTYILHHKNLNY